MKALRVGDDFYLNSDSIELVQRAGTRPAERERKRAETQNQLYNATKGKPARSLLTLKSGWVVISPALPETLVSRPLIHPPCKPSVRSGAATRDNAQFWEEWEQRK